MTELPQECTDYYSLERLVLYHNFIRSIPDSVIYLQSLQFLDLSRNSLSYLPPTICELPLQGLIVNNNKLVSLPEEIGKMSTLMQLDASCNEITHLPVQIGDLASLKTLNLRRNHLQEIPIGKMPIFFKGEIKLWGHVSRAHWVKRFQISVKGNAAESIYTCNYAFGNFYVAWD